MHSLSADHHVFINLSNSKIYCLPDGYEVEDSSLADIKYVHDPSYTAEQIRSLDEKKSLEQVQCLSLDGQRYFPGVVGLNNIKSNDSMNVILLAILHVAPIRDFFLSPSNYQQCKSALVAEMGLFCRKLWNARNFKSHISPHEIFQAISVASKKKFMLGNACDPLAFVTWLLNRIHEDLSQQSKTTVIDQALRGRLQVTVEKDLRTPEEIKNGVVEKTVKTSTKKIPFLFLTVDITEAPLFKNDVEGNIIPQAPLVTLLQKFNGEQWQDLPVQGERRKHKILSLPKYLIFHLKRFTENRFFKEKNPTIVTFPVQNLNMEECNLTKFSFPSFSNNHSCLVVENVENKPQKYDLVASITHNGTIEKGFYTIFIRQKSIDKWFEVKDLDVVEVSAQKVAVSEAYIQIWEHQN